MNYRALALGAAIGFVAAVVPSCGSSKCGPANCAGCCDEKTNTCVKSPSNGNNTTCGASGVACVDCSASMQTCSMTFKCSGGTGGGAGGGGGSTCNSVNCANGCCAGTQCIPSTAQNSTNCGKNGSMCTSCVSPNMCSAGACTPPMGNIGDSCTSDSDCAAVDVATDPNGGPAVCHKQQEQIFPGATAPAFGATYPGGYCTRQCYDDKQCGTNNVCGYYGGEWGEALNICYKGCTNDTDCRSGYTCLQVTGGTPPGVCTPTDGGTAQFDAGTAPARNTVGKACMTDSDCQTETKYGSCILGTPDAGFPGGYCTVDCTMVPSDSWCMGTNTDQDGGAWCLPSLFADPQTGAPFLIWQCVQGCALGGTDCRSGYSCAANPLFGTNAQNQPNGINTCEPDCTLVSDCSAHGDCNTSIGCFSPPSGMQSGFTCNTTTKVCQ